MNYYTLIVRWDDNSPWSIEFGDYDRETVKDELDSLKDQMNTGDDEYTNFYAAKIIKTGHNQVAIDRKVQEYNSVFN